MNNQGNSEGEFRLSVKGIVGIAIALTVLGGGALALTQQRIETNAEGGNVENIIINSPRPGN